jgi:hypothetical protein
MRSAVFLSFAVCFVSVIAAIPVVPFSFDDVHQGQCCAIIYLYKLSDYYVYTKGYNNNPLTIHANAKISSPCNIPFFFKYFSWPFFLSDFLGWFHSLCILCIYAFADSSFIVYGHIYIFAICISHSKVSDFAPTVSYPSSAGAAFRIFEGKKEEKRERIFRR